MKNLLAFIFLLLPFWGMSQNPVMPSSLDERQAAFAQREALVNTSLVKNIPFKSVGPSVFGGRVVDIAVNPSDPSHFYVAYASGGLWYTESNGASFEPVFDEMPLQNIGAVNVNWDKNIIWVGTGEVNSSRSSYAGYGVYKSTNGGKSWTHLGLENTQHIGRIILHPEDTQTAWIAALGNLYSPSKERGIYKTTDGGKTWNKTLYVNENAGAVDLIIDSANPEILYAATWDRTRRAWNFVESGIGSGIHRSMDGGITWEEISGAKTGFPKNEGVGRIGLTHSKNGEKTVLYAVLDNYNRRPDDKDKKDKNTLTKDELRTMSKESFTKLNDEELNDFLKSNNFPKKYTAKSVKEMVQEGTIKPLALTEYLEDANSLLFDSPVVSTEVYRSNDDGRTWQKTHDDYLDNIFYSYGYYFAQIRVMPDNPEKLYIMGVPILTSDDGGKNWRGINAKNVHVDHHALWLNPNRSGHIINGNDGGINISYDDGASWFKCNTPAVGQFYSVNVDNKKPYNIYGGLQDNGVWTGKSTYQAGVAWHNSGHYGYKSIMGGDGMQVAIDSRTDDLVYTGYQFGNYFRINTKTDKRKYITPKHELGERPLRWNWQSPIHISKHNQDIIYFGSNKLHRSFDKGDHFAEISDDLTNGGIKGDVAYGTLTTIDESPIKFGLIYVGTDDGNIHVTQDGGNSWKRISDNLPQNMWVTRVFSSPHDEATVYASLNGYRWDNFEAMIYKSENYGQTWEKIGKNLPNEAVNVIKQDQDNENLIYVGTDHGAYVSIDGGVNFMILQGDLPAVAVHDLVVQNREKDLVLATHGRSFWSGNIKELQLLHDTILQQNLFVFEMPKVKHKENWGSSWSKWLEPTTPEVKLPVYAKTSGELNIKIQTESGINLHTTNTNVTKGLNYPITDLTFEEKVKDEYQKYLNENREEGSKKIDLEAAKNDKFYLKSGTYKVIFEMNGERKTRDLTIE